MKQSMYCLSCESWEQVVNDGHMNFLPPYDGEPAEIEFCYGPFVYSEPPEPLTEAEWRQVFANEPAADEMVLLDKEASNFFIDTR